MGIGENIKKRRKELGISQTELAQRMGYKSSTTITKIEKEINDVTQSTIKKFADVLFTTPSYLMGWVEESTPSAPLQPQKFNLLDDEDKKTILEHIDFLLSKDKYQKRDSSAG